MKLRTLIVDLDCPYGINHFNLMPCEECLMPKDLSKTITAPVPFHAPITDYKFQWTTTDTNDTTVTWGNDTSTSAHADHFTVNASDITVWNTSIVNF